MLDIWLLNSGLWSLKIGDTVEVWDEKWRMIDRLYVVLLLVVVSNLKMLSEQKI